MASNQKEIMWLIQYAQPRPYVYRTSQYNKR